MLVGRVCWFDLVAFHKGYEVHLRSDIKYRVKHK